MRIARTSIAAAAAALLATTLTACVSVVPMVPAEGANDPGCADLIVRLPDTVAGQERRDTNAQATGAWGSPPTVLLYCGVEVPSASTKRCILVEGIYWLVDDSQEPTYVLRSYGREPAVDVVVDGAVTGPTPALTDLSRAKLYTRPNGHECTDLEDADIAGEPAG